MLDLKSRLNALCRPRLLVRAARTQAAAYRRTSHLRRLLGTTVPPVPTVAILHLLDLEAEYNMMRITKDAGYLISRHIDILIALMGEAEIFLSAAQSNRRPSRVQVADGVQPH